MGGRVGGRVDKNVEKNGVEQNEQSPRCLGLWCNVCSVFVPVITGKVHTPLCEYVRRHSPGHIRGRSSWSLLSLRTNIIDCPTFPLAAPALVLVESRVQPPLSLPDREVEVYIFTKLIIFDREFSSERIEPTTCHQQVGEVNH